MTISSEQKDLFEPDDMSLADFNRSDISISEDGTWVAMGTPAHGLDENSLNLIVEAGACYIYKKVNGVYIQKQKIVGSSRIANNEFGSRVWISAYGRRLFVASKNDSNSVANGGSVSVYDLDETNDIWNFKSKIELSTPIANAKFGWSIMSDYFGHLIVIGSPFESNGGTLRGAGYLFTYDGSTFNQLNKFSYSKALDNSRFGYSVAISGDGNIIFMGMTLVDLSGAVGVFKKNVAGSFLPIESSVLRDPDGLTNDYFSVAVETLGSVAGNSMVIDHEGRNLYIGAYNKLDISGVRGVVFRFTGDKDYNYTLKETIVQREGKTLDTTNSISSRFGFYLAIDKYGKLLAVGAKGDGITTLVSPPSLPAPVLSTLESNTVETLGAAVSELHTNANAASITNEANAIAGFTSANNAILSSVASPVSNGTYAISAESNTTPTNAASIAYDMSGLTPGQPYILTFYARHNGTGGNWEIRLNQTATGGGGTIWERQNLTSSDTTYIQYIFEFVHDATFTKYLVFRENSGTNDGGVYIDALSIKASNQLVTCPSFSSNSSPYIKGAGWSISGGSANAVAGMASALEQDISAVAGIYNTVVYIVAGQTAGTMTPKIGGVDGTTINANGTYAETILASDAGNLQFNKDSAWNGNISNVTVYPAVPDSSTNADGLEIHGEIIKNVVAPGAEMVAYSNYGVDNFIKQPYSSNLDFSATGDFSIVGWFYFTSLPTIQVLCRRGDTSNVTAINLTAVNNDIKFVTRASSINSDITTTSAPLNLNTWHFICVTRSSSGTILKVYVDGILIDSATVIARNIDTIEPFWIGNGSDVTNRYVRGSITLFDVYPVEITDIQFEEIYDYQKLHFEDNAGSYPLSSLHEDTGAVYVYKRDLTLDNYAIKIEEDTPIINNHNGNSVAISNDGKTLISVASKEKK